MTKWRSKLVKTGLPDFVELVVPLMTKIGRGVV